MYRVLLLCSDNSLLSPMAEGYFRSFIPYEAEIFSAGIKVRKLDPLGVKIMREDKIDISQTIQHKLTDLKHIDFDYVLTCDEDSEAESHHLPSKLVKYHYEFDKLIQIDSVDNTEEMYCNLRNHIKRAIRAFVKEHFVNAKAS